MSQHEIAPSDAIKLIEQGWLCVDVRSPGEWRAVHAKNSINIPLDKLGGVIESDPAIKQNKLVLICQSGGRSRKALEKLSAFPGIEAVSVTGGTSAWEAAGLPVEKGKGVISIERQVRIVAGALVFLGSLLALKVHPAFIALPIFVGAGLVFAGITDFCGMGLLLSKMPWNQGSLKSS